MTDTTNTLPGVVVDASGQPQQKAGRIDTDPAIQSFKTAGEYRLDAGKSKIQALVAATLLAGGNAVATLINAGRLLGEGPDILGVALTSATGIATIFCAAVAGGLLKAVMARIEADTRIAYELKVHAKALQDKVTELHLRASMKDAQGAGEAVGDLGASTPTATITSINAGKTGRLQ